MSNTHISIGRFLWLVLLLLGTIGCGSVIRPPTERPYVTTVSTTSTSLSLAAPTSNAVAFSGKLTRTATPTSRATMTRTPRVQRTRTPTVTPSPTVTSVTNTLSTNSERASDRFELEKASTTKPIDIPSEVAYFASGGGGGNSSSSSTCGILSVARVVEVGKTLIIDSFCGFVAGEIVVLNISFPDGSIYKDSAEVTNDSQGRGKVSFSVVIEPTYPIGTYEIELSGDTTTASTTLEVTNPEGPRMFEWQPYAHSGPIPLTLYNFQPYEGVQLLVYKHRDSTPYYDFYAVSEYVTDSTGRLDLFLDSQLRSEEYGYFVVGEFSGEAPFPDKVRYPLDEATRWAESYATRVALDTIDNSPTPFPDCAVQANPLFLGLWQSQSNIIGCATAPLMSIPTIAEEAFEGGHLFWRSDTNTTYAIYDRAKTGEELTQGLWRTDQHWNWGEAGEPDPDGIGLTPPANRVEPKRGFGWLWRTYLGRETGELGWALDREYGFDNIAQVQYFQNGIIFKGSSSKIYMLLNNGQFVALVS